MRIIQLTDLHISKIDEYTFDIDVRQKFVDALAKVKEIGCDLLVISGDFCYQMPHQEIYDWIIEQTKDFPIPIEVISGNHDDTPMLAKAFHKEDNLTADRLYFNRQFEDTDILFLDTMPATIGHQQHQWLQQQLAQMQAPTTIFMHHPPFPCGVPFMDQQHAFKESALLLNTLEQHPFPITIFCGHYHVEKTITHKNITVHITPSTFYQLSDKNPDFEVDHVQSGLRIIDINSDELAHQVVYF